MKVVHVNHVEIPVLDLEKAKKFFGKVFGWSEMFQDWGDTYVLVSNNEPGSISYGLDKVDEIKEGGVIVVLGVDNIDTKLEEIKKAGGEITREKFEIDPSIGFAAYFKDVFGTTFGLHAPPESS